MISDSRSGACRITASPAGAPGADSGRAWCTVGSEFLLIVKCQCPFLPNRPSPGAAAAHSGWQSDLLSLDDKVAFSVTGAAACRWQAVT